MTDDYGYSQPEGAEEDSKGFGKFKPSEWVHTLLPAKQQREPVDNHLLMTLFRPSAMPIFHDVVASDIRTWWIKLAMHYVRAKNENGEDYTAVVLCPREMNTYFSKAYGRPVIYTPVTCPSCATTSYLVTCKCGNSLGVRSVMSDCAYCDESGRWWHMWRLAWEKTLQSEPGYQGRDWKGQYDLKKKSPERHKQLSQAGTDIAHYRDIASEWSASDRYLHIVWDVDKFARRRPLAEGESETPVKKLLFQGSKVFEALKAKHRNGKIFFDPRNGMMVVLTRDTSDGIQRSRYTVDDATLQSLGVQLDQGWLTYLMDERSDPDVTGEVIVLSYDEQVRIAGLNLTQEVAPSSPVSGTTPLVSPPTMPPAAPVIPQGYAVPPGPPTPPAPAPAIPPMSPPMAGPASMGGRQPMMPPAPPVPPAMPGTAPAPPPFAPPPLPPLPPASMAPPGQQTLPSGFQPAPLAPNSPRRKQWNS